MNINLDGIKEDLQGRAVSIEIGDSANMVLQHAIVLPMDDKSSFSIFNDKAVVRDKGDVFRLCLKDIEMLERYYDKGVKYSIKCKRSGFYTVSVLDIAS